MIFTDDDRIELGKFLRSPAGQNLIHLLRDQKAVMPAHFTPADGVIQQHHISLHYAFDIGQAAKVDQILKLAESTKKPPEPEQPKLFDTKQLV